MAAKYSSIRRMLGVAGLVVAVSGGALLAQAAAAPAQAATPSAGKAAAAASAPAAAKVPATATPSPSDPASGSSTSAPSSTSTPSSPPAPASAVPPGTLTPLVDCIVDAPLGSTVTSRTVLLGYRSSAHDTLRVVAAAGSNGLAPGRADRGQPTAFEPGEHHAVWSLTLDARSTPSATWQLGGATVTIDADAPSCATVTTVALSAPRVAASGATITVSAAVGRLFLAPPTDGTVEFAVDGAAPVTTAVGADGVARADLPAPPPGDHTVTAAYRPVDGSQLRPSTRTSPLTVTTATGALGITATSVTPAADGGTAMVTVSRASGAGAASVDYATADGTAVAGTEYTASRGTLAFHDGQTSATVEIRLAARAPGAPASTFFVLLQRATTTVDAASATITLPAVPSTPGGAAVTGASRSGGIGGDSVLPAGDPTSPSPVAHAEDLAMLIGAALLTAGGILGVVGLVRFGGSREARV